MNLKWEEPAEFFRAYMESTGTIPSRRNQILAGFIAAAVVALLTLGYEWFFFLLHNKDLGVPLYFYFVAPAITGIFVAYLTPLLLSISAMMILNDQGIYRNKAYGSKLTVAHWPWESITELSIEDVQYGNRSFRALVVRTREEPGDLVFGLGQVPEESIRQFAHQMGKTLVIRGRQ